MSENNKQPAMDDNAEASQAIYDQVTAETDMGKLAELFSQPMGESVPLQQILDELEEIEKKLGTDRV